MASLSSYDKGKKSFEGRRYRADVEAAKAGMERLMAPIQAAKPKYTPTLILTLGNHEDRITRAINDDAKLDGTISIDDLGYAGFGWKVYPFLQTVEIDGILYSHFFPR